MDEQLLLKRIQALEDKLQKIEQRDHVDWNNGLTLGAGLQVGTNLLVPNGYVTSKQFYNASYTIADDTVQGITPGVVYGIIIINLRINTYTDIWGIVNYRLSTTTICQALLVGSALNVATVSGVPVYSSYTDVKVTVVASDNGNIYIVNRRGASITVGTTFIGV